MSHYASPEHVDAHRSHVARIGYVCGKKWADIRQDPTETAIAYHRKAKSRFMTSDVSPTAADADVFDRNFWKAVNAIGP